MTFYNSHLLNVIIIIGTLYPQSIFSEWCTNAHVSPSQVETVSCFQLDHFESLLLPENNRPLEPSVLLVLKELFNRTNANTTALHMLSVDCQVTSRPTVNPL